MKHLKLGFSDPILIDLEALRRTKPRIPIDLARAPSARKEPPKSDDDSITLEMTDPLAAIIALARRKTRR